MYQIELHQINFLFSYSADVLTQKNHTDSSIRTSTRREQYCTLLVPTPVPSALWHRRLGVKNLAVSSRQMYYCGRRPDLTWRNLGKIGQLNKSWRQLQSDTQQPAVPHCKVVRQQYAPADYSHWSSTSLSNTWSAVCKILSAIRAPCGH